MPLPRGESSNCPSSFVLLIHSGYWSLCWWSEYLCWVCWRPLQGQRGCQETICRKVRRQFCQGTERSGAWLSPRPRPIARYRRHHREWNSSLGPFSCTHERRNPQKHPRYPSPRLRSMVGGWSLREWVHQRKWYLEDLEAEVFPILARGFPERVEQQRGGRVRSAWFKCVSRESNGSRWNCGAGNAVAGYKGCPIPLSTSCDWEAG